MWSFPKPNQVVLVLLPHQTVTMITMTVQKSTHVIVYQMFASELYCETLRELCTCIDHDTHAWGVIVWHSRPPTKLSYLTSWDNVMQQHGHHHPLNPLSYDQASNVRYCTCRLLNIICWNRTLWRRNQDTAAHLETRILVLNHNQVSRVPYKSHIPKH